MEFYLCEESELRERVQQQDIKEQLVGEVCNLLRWRIISSFELTGAIVTLESDSCLAKRTT